MLRKNGPSQGYVLLFGGSDGAPPGPRWLIWDPWWGIGWGRWGFRLRLPVVTLCKHLYILTLAITWYDIVFGLANIALLTTPEKPFFTFFFIFLYKTEEKTLKKLGYVCYGTPSPNQNIWWREAGAKPFFQWKKHKNSVFEPFFAFLLPDKLPNSKKTPENVVFEILGYI